MSNPDYLTISPDDIPIMLDRLFTKIHKDHETGCWNWIASKIKHGYGHIRYKGRIELAHRVMYTCLVGPLPRGRAKSIPELDHIVCNNTSCCNPAHLRLVLHSVNMLRSNALPAINARKTHCIRGHLLPSAKGRQRTCLVCIRISRANKRRA